jgi:hypothetical protein
MKVVDVQYVKEREWLGFLLDTGARLFYGAGVVPGTDVPTYRFVQSSGFEGSREAYKYGKELACKYSRELGFPGIQEHFESFTG